MKAKRKNNKDPKENSFKILIEDFDISEYDEKGEEILNLLINNNFLTLDQYQNISEILQKAIKDKDIELIEILLSEEIETNDFLYKINPNRQTASIYKFLRNDNNIVVPRSIMHNRECYSITSIIDSGSKNPKYHKKLKFVEDSELHTVHENSFNDSSIEYLYIPPKLNELRSGWCAKTNFLTRIELSPENQNFVMKDDQFLLGKSDPKSDNFDVLLFSVRNITTAHIPPNIKVVSPCAFHGCRELAEVEIPENSELRKIGKFAFAFSNIKELFIPSRLSKLDEGWCAYANCLARIESSPENQYFVMKDDQLLLGKSDPKSDKFDVLHFAVRDLTTAHIPSNIKVISPFAFQGCQKLDKVEIPENSE